MIKSIENIPEFNRLLSLAAFRTGGLLNLSDLSRETGLPYTTLRRYMSLLEVTYQIFMLQPLVIEKMTMGGTWIPSAASRERLRAALPCQRTVRAKKKAWLGRERLTRTNSEKKIRRSRLRAGV